MPPNWLGDVILAQPALRSITTQFKNSKIHVFGRAWLDDLLPFLNLEHESITYDQSMPKRSDAVFIFPNSLRSALQSFRSRAKHRIGFRNEGRGVFLTHAYTPRIDLIEQHHRSYYLDLLQQHGIPIPFDKVDLVSPEVEKKTAYAQLQGQGIDSNKFICVAPGAQFGGAKRYPAESYRYVLSKISEAGWDIVILGTTAEREIAELCVSQVKGRYWNAVGSTSLRQALQLVSVSHLMLCNDSGLMHVAAGLGIPTVAIFGATNPQRTSPSGKYVDVLYKPAWCSPCLKRECFTQGHPCMTNVSPEMVVKSCLRGLKSVGT